MASNLQNWVHRLSSLQTVVFDLQALRVSLGFCCNSCFAFVWDSPCAAGPFLNVLSCCSGSCLRNSKLHSGKTGRWVADLRELEPFDEREVVQRMGIHVRALFLIANWQQTSLPWMSRYCAFKHWRCKSHRGASKKWRDTPRSCLKKLCRSGGAVWRRSVKRASGSFKALATHVLGHHREMETVSRLVVTSQCPACRAIYGDRNAAHRH